MLDLPSILVASDDFDWMKLIPVGIILILWAIGAATSAAKRSAAAKPPPRPVLPPVPPVAMRRSAAPAWAAPPNPPPLPPRFAALQAIAALPPVPVPRPPPVPRRRKKAAVAPAPPPPLVITGPVAEAPAFPETPMASGFQLAGGETGARLRLTAAALRSAVAFTEVFDPPVALRDEGALLESNRI